MYAKLTPPWPPSHLYPLDTKKSAFHLSANIGTAPKACVISITSLIPVSYTHLTLPTIDPG